MTFTDVISLIGTLVGISLERHGHLGINPLPMV